MKKRLWTLLTMVVLCTLLAVSVHATKTLENPQLTGCHYDEDVIVIGTSSSFSNCTFNKTLTYSGNVTFYNCTFNSTVTCIAKTADELTNALSQSFVTTIQLGDDITISNTLSVNRTVILDLNGHVLNGDKKDRVIYVSSTGDLTLNDSNPNAAHKFSVDQSGFYTIDPNGSQTVKGGVITGGYLDMYGGGVRVDGGKFTMNGGNIIGNHSNHDGGGVYISSGVFTMNDGKIFRNFAAIGKDVYIYSGTIHMTGGMIGDIPEYDIRYQSSCHIKGTMYADGGVVNGIVGNYGTITQSDTATSATVFYGVLKEGDNSQISGNKVTFNNNGSLYAWEVVASGNKAVAPTVTMPGITFGGWYEDNATTAFDFENTTITAAKTLNAKLTVGEAALLTQDNLADYQDAATGVLVPGNYKLDGDITLTKTLWIDGKVILDLNGHVLNGDKKDRVIYVTSTGDLTLNDSDKTAAHKFRFDETLWRYVLDSQGSHTVYGGVITGGERNSDNVPSGGGYGGGVCVDNGKFTMNGGTIIGNCSWLSGGGVGVWNAGSFIMTGGNIYKNEGPSGSELYMSSNSVFTMTGGMIGDTPSYDIRYQSSCHISGTMYADGGVVNGIVDNYGTITQSADATSATVFYGGLYESDNSQISGKKVTFNNNGSLYAWEVVAPGNKAVAPTVTMPGITFGGWYEDNATTAFDFENTTITAAKTLNAKLTVGTPALLTQDNLADYKYVTGILVPGNYKLDGDITLTKALWINGKVILDLNGHVLNGDKKDRVIYVTSTGDLTLNDSDKTAAHKFSVDETFWHYVLDSQGSHTVYGGVITGGYQDMFGGGVRVDGGKFTMNGGNIIGNYSNHDGSGVYISSGVFTMNDGKIFRNFVALGKDVYINSGTIHMTGGMIGDIPEYDIRYQSSCHIKGTMYADGGVVNGIVDNYGTITQSADATSATVFYGGLKESDNSQISGNIVTFNNNGSLYAWEVVAPGNKAVAPDAPTSEDTFCGWWTTTTATDNADYQFTNAVNQNFDLYANWNCALGHHGGTTSCTAQSICSKCGEGYGTLKDHSFTAEKAVTDAIMTPGTCQNETVYYYSCANCNAVEKDATHTFKGEKDLNNHVDATHYDAVEPTVSSDGNVEYWLCLCGKKFSDAACKNELEDTTLGKYIYTITFDANEGTVDVVSAKTIDGKLTTLPIPTRKNFNFLGWYTAENGGNLVSTDTLFGSNCTIYAHWQQKASSLLPSFAEWEIIDKIIAANKKDEPIEAEPVETAPETSDESTETSTDTPTEPETPWDNPFDDISESDPFYDAIRFVYEHGFMNGIGSSSFAPNDNLTRGMLVTVLYRAVNSPAVDGENPFTDVADDAWYKDAVTWAKSIGLVNGVSDTEFAPDMPITREQVATIFYRYAIFLGYDVSEGEETNILSYLDALDIADYAMAAMQWMCTNGILTDVDGSLLPQDDATRSLVAMMLYRFYNN